MRVRTFFLAMSLGLVTIPLAASAQQAGEPGTCPNDSKLLNGGPTRIFGEGPGTWWGLVQGGLVAAGLVEEDDQIDYLNHLFGTSFNTLLELKNYNLQLVQNAWDENHNGYVCAFQLRGTRAHFGDPFVNFTFFGISDDKVAKK